MRQTSDDRGTLLSNFSLWRSGPLYRFERALKLAREDQRDLGRRAVTFALVGWLPVLALALARGLIVGQWDPLLVRFDPYIRWAIAVPAVLFAGDLADQRIRAVLSYLRGAGIVEGADHEALTVAEGAALRWARSALVEGGLAALALITDLPAAFSAATPAQLWRALIGLSLFRWLVYRWLWRWLLWALLLGRIARLKLRLVGLHPDRAGGLGLTSEPSRAIALLALAGGSILSATWSAQVVYQGARAEDFTSLILAFLAIVLAVGLGPLLVFFPALRRAKYEQLHDHSVLAIAYGREFAARWWGPSRGELLGSQDVQSLADLQGSFGAVADMRSTPVERRQVVQFVGAALVPFLPLALTAVPYTRLIARVLKTLLA